MPSSTADGSRTPPSLRRAARCSACPAWPRWSAGPWRRCARSAGRARAGTSSRPSSAMTMPSSHAQPAGLALALDEGAQHGAQRGARPAAIATSISASASGRVAPVQLHHQRCRRPTSRSICTRASRHLPGDGAEQVGGAAGGGGQQAAQGALLALVGEHASDAQQRDEDPGDQLPGRRVGARVVVDLIGGGARMICEAIRRRGLLRPARWQATASK